MSNSGNFTSLGLNALNGLQNNQGFKISTVAQGYQGVWLPTSYTQGTLTSDTVLNKITLALPNFLANCVPAKLSIANWRSLLTLGSSSCPALGNSRPSTFIPTYAGYGTWTYNTVDSYGNITGSSGSANLTGETYPPKDYGISQTYSYIYQDHGDYAWITGWPGKNSWQKTTDDFSAAYLPSSTGSLFDYDTYFSQGFIATIARQAYYEFWYNYATRRINQYPEFLKTVQLCNSWSKNSNQTIASYVNSQTFLKGNYSNINDLTTSDIAGVNQAFKLFGNDLIRLGKTLDMSYIHVFGLPSKFILNLQSCNALTDALKIALLYSDLSTIELNNILLPTYTPSSEQEKKLYEALLLIQGQDLEDIKIITNCSTEGLTSLADLIDPQKMFPESYGSLTIPEYSTVANSSKVYQLIYSGTGVNTNIRNWGDYLSDILPDDLAIACGAFMMTMNQIKNIRQMNTEKIAQVIANLEVTNKDLPLINSTDGIPGDITSINNALSRIAFGSGNGGVYRFCDFFGAAGGWPYRDYYSMAEDLLKKLPVTNLNILYMKLFQKSLGNDWALLSSGTTTNAVKLFVITAGASIGATTVSVTSDATQVLSPGDIIAFSNADSLTTPVVNQYTVSSVTTTGVVFSPALAVALNLNDRIFVYQTNYNTTVPNLVTAVNNEISTIVANDPAQISQLNYYWSQIGNQLAIEQRAIALSLQQTEIVYTSATGDDLDSFIRSVPNYALETDYSETAPVLEAMCDTTNVAGQSLLAMFRESRNAQRIINAGGDVDNDVPSQVQASTPSAVATVVNGAITAITVTAGGSGYGRGCDCCTPIVTIFPQGGVFGGSGNGAIAQAIMDENGSVQSITVLNPGSGYSSTNPPAIHIEPPPQPTRLGGPIVPGSFAGSPYIGPDPIPDNLISSTTASYTVAEAQGKVNS